MVPNWLRPLGDATVDPRNMSGSSEKMEALIEEVRKFTYLYDLRDHRFKDAALKKNTWIQIPRILADYGIYYAPTNGGGADASAV